MVRYFGRHGCKKFMKNKPVKFYPCKGKDDFLDPALWLGRPVVDKLTDSLPKHAGSNYPIIIDNFFTNPQFLRSSKEKEIAATGNV